GKIVIESQPRKHTRFRWVLRDGTALVFIDQRRFGSVELLSNVDCQNRFQKLGAEPWPAYRDGAWYRRRWGKSKGSIKSTMLKQEHVAGIGNIMASEICFRMGIDPRISCERLNERDWEALGVELHRFVEAVLEEESSPEIAFVSQGGALPKAFLVYGRNGQSCGCGTIIQVMKQAGRSTYWCPRCQVSR
ncbi:MAG: zinc finger domain-containing protein, partial [Myxococcota bacterium]|nr:zinc finger domain-containing protein [Myxococcota bacterium]